jgi:hypothetical protein
MNAERRNAELMNAERRNDELKTTGFQFIVPRSDFRVAFNGGASWKC